jgi:hypothetical protein
MSASREQAEEAGQELDRKRKLLAKVIRGSREEKRGPRPGRTGPSCCSTGLGLGRMQFLEHSNLPMVAL